MRRGGIKYIHLTTSKSVHKIVRHNIRGVEAPNGEHIDHAPISTPSIGGGGPKEQTQVIPTTNNLPKVDCHTL